nr:MAG TPA: hypothetical protein [Bacteriophage sp.]
MITQTPTFKYNPIPNIAPYIRDAVNHMMENISKQEYAQLADFMNDVQNDIVGHNHEHDDALKNSDIEYRETDILIHGQGEVYKLDISVNLEGDINYAELITPENEIISANLSFASLSPKQLIVISLADGLLRGILGIMFSDEELQERLDSINDEDEDNKKNRDDVCCHLKSIGYDPDTFTHDEIFNDIQEISKKYFMNEEYPWLTPEDFSYFINTFADVNTDEYGDPCGLAPTMHQYDPETKRQAYLFSIGEDTMVVEIIDEKIDAVIYYTNDVERHISDSPETSDFDKIFLFMGHGCMMAYGYYLTLQEKDNA